MFATFVGLVSEPIETPLGLASGAGYIAALAGGEQEAVARCLLKEKTENAFQTLKKEDLGNNQALEWRLRYLDSIRAVRSADENADAVALAKTWKALEMKDEEATSTGFVVNIVDEKEVVGEISDAVLVDEATEEDNAEVEQKYPRRLSTKERKKLKRAKRKGE